MGMVMRKILLALSGPVVLVSCSDSKPAPPEAEKNEPAIAPTVSLGQALRCTKIADLAVKQAVVAGRLSATQARSIALTAKNAAYAEGAKQELTPREVEEEEYRIYLGHEYAGRVTLIGPPPSQQERDASERARAEKLANVAPELEAELSEICAPLFLGSS